MHDPVVVAEEAEAEVDPAGLVELVAILEEDVRRVIRNAQLAAELLGFQVVRGGDDQRAVEMRQVVRQRFRQKIGIVDTDNDSFDLHR